MVTVRRPPFIRRRHVPIVFRRAPGAGLGRNRPRAIRVTRTDGSRVVLEDPVLRSDTVSGLVADKREGQQQVSIPVADVQQVETPRFDVARTFGLFAGLGVLVLATIAIAFAIACSRGACAT